MFNQQNARGALKISKAISLGLVAISLISLSLVSAPMRADADGLGTYGPVNCPLRDAAFVGAVPVNGAFDASGIGRPTSPVAINNLGKIVGVVEYVDNAQSHRYGFFRNPALYAGPLEGNCFLFEVILPDYTKAVLTQPVAVNDLGAIAGFYKDASSGPLGFRGFVRSPYGSTYYQIDVPGALYTVPAGINNLGQVTGVYRDSTGRHGFLWNGRDLTLTYPIDVLLNNGPSLNTTPTGINNLGQVVGSYLDTSSQGTGKTYGFVRDANGRITVFGSGSYDIVPQAINDLGQVTGVYGSGGFVRDANGIITAFSVPSAKSTFPNAINNLGQVQGVWNYGQPYSIGFVRHANGTIVNIGDRPVGGLNDQDQVIGSTTVPGLPSPQDGRGYVQNLLQYLAVPFAQFSVTRTDIVKSVAAFSVDGTFTLGAGGAINPLTDPLVVKLYGMFDSSLNPALRGSDALLPHGVASIAIPGGSFQRSAGSYVYNGVLHGVPVQATITPGPGGSYRLHVSAAGFPPYWVPYVNPVTVTLSIGENTGAATVNATIH